MHGNEVYFQYFYQGFCSLPLICNLSTAITHNIHFGAFNRYEITLLVALAVLEILQLLLDDCLSFDFSVSFSLLLKLLGRNMIYIFIQTNIVEPVDLLYRGFTANSSIVLSTYPQLHLSRR